MASSSNTLPKLPTLTWDDCRLLVESVTDYAIFMLDPDGHVTTWNRGAEKIKGYTAAEILGRPFDVFFTQEDIAAGKPAHELLTAREQGRAADEGWRLRKDGSRFWASVVTTALHDEAGKLRGFGKVTRDLTLRRIAEEQLRESERRFHHLVDAVTDYAIFLLDESGHVATWNEGARRLKGWEPDEIIGKHFSAFYTAEDRAKGRPLEILETVRREGRFEDESWRIRKDGTRFWANVVITALRNERGEVIGFAKVTRDLTPRREADERVRRAEERFRLLVEGVADYAIYMLDPEGRITTWNLGAERMKGYAAEDILGRSFAAFFTPEDIAAGKPQMELAQARLEGRFAGEGWRLRKDGTRFWAGVVLTALRNDRGELIGFGKVTRDMTAQRQAEANERTLVREQAARSAAQENEQRLRASEEAARDAARRAEEANRVKDEFLATVSHELRTPLNAILGWSKMLGDRARDPSLTKGLDVIRRNAEAQARIVEDILDVSRIVTGKLRLDVKAADITLLAREAIDVVRPSAQARRIAIDLAKSDDVIVAGDPERLRQVIWNLLSNAVKFTEPGGAIVVSVQAEGSKAIVSVEDTGRGIDPDFLPHVFERFKQADSSTTRHYGGLGLGLAIVRHIVELHGGQVRAESAGRGKGARFTVTLPVRALFPTVTDDPHEEERAGSRPPPRDAVPSLDGLRVLAVDDDADAREMLFDVLVDAGAQVETADSAAAGIEAVRRFRPQLIVSDIGMPLEDGYSFIRRVRELPASEGGGVPSIALTAYTRAQDRTKALAAGFTTHVGKPVDPQDLVAAIANIAALTRR